MAAGLFGAESLADRAPDMSESRKWGANCSYARAATTPRGAILLVDAVDFGLTKFLHSTSGIKSVCRAGS